MPRITERILEPSLSPFPFPSFYIPLNKEYYSTEKYKTYRNHNSIAGVASDDVLDYLNRSEIDLKIKLKVIMFLSMLRIKERNGGGHSGWINMRIIFIENVFGTRDWPKIKKICVDQKFIEVNEHYRIGVFCRQYRLNPENKKYKTIRYFATGKSFNTLLRKLKEIPKKNAPNLENEFERKITNHFSEILAKLELASGYEEIIETIKTPKKQEVYNQSCDRILNKDFNVAVNRENGRWTSSATNFPKILRKKLLYEDEGLAELDFSNMQPWMAIKLYPFECPEKQEYLKLVQSAKFYEFFAEKTCHDISTTKKKKNFKRRILREVYFGGLEKVEFYKNWRVFCGYFPILAGIILKEREKGKRQFALNLQKRESLIVINGALIELIDKGIPCLTIHDSILCRVQDTDTVFTSMRKHFMRYIPHEPNIKIDVDKKLEKKQSA